MILQKLRKLEVVMIVFILLLSAVSPVSGSLLAADGADGAAQAVDDEVFSASENVEIWDRSLLPLRADYDGAATSITGPAININLQERNTGDVPLNKEQMGVFNAGDEIEFAFQERTGAGTSEFSDTEATVLVAKMEPRESSSEALTGMDMTEFSDIATEDANDEFDFAIADTLTLDGDGEGTFTYTPEESGQYAFFVIQNIGGGDGVTVENVNNGYGDLKVSNDVRIIGMDGALVQDGPSNVEVRDSRQRPGQTFTFDVDANLEDGSDVTHSIVLYDEDKLQSQSFNIVVEGEIDNSITADQVTVKHSIETVNGVANIPDELTDSSEFDDGSVTGPTQLSDVVKFAADETGAKEPTTELIDSESTLDASVTAVDNKQGEVTIQVETRSDWETGQYRYVHFAVGEQTNDIATSDGVVNVANRRRGGGGGGGGGGGAGPVTDVEDRIQNGRYILGIDQLDPGTTVRRLIENAPRVNGLSLQQFDFTASNTIQNGQIDIETLSERPSNVPDTGVPTVAYFNVVLNGFDDSSVASGAFRFSLSESALEQLDASPDEVTVYRFHSGEWQALDTEHVSGDTYKAETPGFSYFAVGKAQASGQPNFNIESASLGAQSIAVDETVTVEASVSNDGDAAGTQTVTLTANGETLDEQDVQLDAGESTTVTFEVSFSEAGTYDLAVDGNNAGSLEVVQQGSDDQDPGDQTSPDATPEDGGLGVLPILGALIVLALAIGAFYFRDELQEQLK